jgi:hypothetical protein
VSTAASFCEHCGESIEAASAAGTADREQSESPAEVARETEPTPKGGHAKQREEITPDRDTTSDATTTSPAWPLGVMTVCWVLFLVGFGSGTTAGQGVAGLAVLASLPVIWVDARKAKAADELEVGYPVLVPVAILLLWILTLPAYVLYRYTNRG